MGPDTPTPVITVIAYDIAESRRRAKVARLLQDHGGARIQYSVFELDLHPDRLHALQLRLAALIRPARDRLHFYPVCATCFAKARSIGPAYEGNLPAL